MPSLCCFWSFLYCCVCCALMDLQFDIFHRLIAFCCSVSPDTIDVACNIFRNVYVCNTVRSFRSDSDLPDILDACSPRVRAPGISGMSEPWPAVLVTASHMLISRFCLIWCFDLLNAFAVLFWSFLYLCYHLFIDKLRPFFWRHI